MLSYLSWLPRCIPSSWLRVGRSSTDLPTPTCGARAAGWRELECTCACAHVPEASCQHTPCRRWTVRVHCPCSVLVVQKLSMVTSCLSPPCLVIDYVAPKP